MLENKQKCADACTKCALHTRYMVYTYPLVVHVQHKQPMHADNNNQSYTDSWEKWRSSQGMRIELLATCNSCSSVTNEHAICDCSCMYSQEWSLSEHIQLHNFLKLWPHLSLGYYSNIVSVIFWKVKITCGHRACVSAVAVLALSCKCDMQWCRTAIFRSQTKCINALLGLHHTKNCTKSIGMVPYLRTLRMTIMQALWAFKWTKRSAVQVMYWKPSGCHFLMQKCATKVKTTVTATSV